MLRINEKDSSAAAKAYYTGSFTKGDYYTESQEIIGNWIGQGAARLGLCGPVDDVAFHALCDNLHPATREQLTPRMNSNRIVGWDFTFDVPKSVSVLHAITGDHRIIKEFERAVDETVLQLEADVHTRVRLDGQKDGTRVTGNLAGAKFLHLTARPVDGVPDPQIHEHVFVFNSTFDPVEKRWKAAMLRPVYEDADYFQSTFHSRLREGLQRLGYSVTGRGLAFEVNGVPEELIPMFSRRTAVIERTAEAMGITDDEVKSKLGAMTREAKAKELKPDELRAIWRERLSDEQREAVRAVYQKAMSRSKDIGAMEPFLPSSMPFAAGVEKGAGMSKGEHIGSSLASMGSAEPRVLSPREVTTVDQAILHCFSTQSVVTQRQLEASVLRFGIEHVGVGDARRLVAAHPELIRVERDGKTLITTKRVLAEEYLLTDWVRNGRGMLTPLARHHQIGDQRLGADQRAAVMHVLESMDRVTGIEGRAGTGKTTLMRETVKAIEATGHKVMVMAPTAVVARELLRKEGFTQANTIERWLRDRKLQAQIGPNAVWWIDEAALISMPDMARLARLAETMNARMVLTGDTFQHRAVQRGDAMRILKEKAGLDLAEVTVVRRQKGTYREAVEAFARGNLLDGFEGLDRMGAVHEVGMEEGYQSLAAKYLEILNRGRKPLVVSPTHSEIRKLTTVIRKGLKDAGNIKTEREVEVLWPIPLSEAELADVRSYRTGQVLEFMRDGHGYAAGDRLTIVAVKGAGLEVEQSDGRRMQIEPSPTLPLIGQLQVFQPETVALGIGERIRITQNGKTVDGKHALHNGSFHTVKGFTSEGDILLEEGRVSRNFRHFNYGYASTSYVAQGRNVDTVLVAENEQSFVAASREQFYVSVSRGIEELHVYTNSYEGLMEAVRESSQRMAAMDLVEEWEQQEVEKTIAPPQPIKALLGEIPSNTRIEHLEEFVPQLPAGQREPAKAQLSELSSSARLTALSEVKRLQLLTPERLERLREQLGTLPPTAKIPTIDQMAKKPEPLAPTRKPKAKETNLGIKLGL